MPSSSEFEVEGRTVIITGGSSGLGLEIACQLAAKGAHIAIVARDQGRLTKGLALIQEAAKDKEKQRFHQISADLALSSQAVRVVDEVMSWNLGLVPDIVWCCAGSSHPTLLIDTPVETFSKEMDSNYFSSLYLSHAILKHWLKEDDHVAVNQPTDKSDERGVTSNSGRHLIFTSSILAFHTFIAYTTYSPTKAAIRSLSDTLSQEMNLYAAAHPDKPKVHLHTVFPAGILTEGYQTQNKIKPDVTKVLEGVDEPLTPQVVASRSFKALESGHEIITVDSLTGIVKRSMPGGSISCGFSICYDWFLAGFLGICMIFIRWDMDKQVRAFGSKFGISGMKSRDASSS